MKPTAIPSVSRFQPFDLLATLVAVVHGDAAVVYANAALEDALGMSRRSIEGSDLAEHYTEPATLAAALGGLRDNEFAALRYDAWLKRPGRDPLPVHVILTQTDQPGDILIEMLPLEQQARQEREERLIDQAQANKELIRNLAHEIKNPLGALRGAAQLLDRELERPELHEYTQVIMKEADRLQSLMDRLLTPHRLPQISQFNVHEALERVRSLLQAEFPDGIVIERDYDVSLPSVTADREQIIQALLNIARNGAQAMQGKGRITLRTRIARRITLAKKMQRLALVVHIIDNGPGIAEELKDKIFFPLISGREGGHGIGLTIAQNFVSQHHGTIEVESRPGETRFSVQLPIAGEADNGNCNGK